MSTVILENTDRFRLDSIGNGAAYEMTDKKTGESRFVQYGDDAETFRDEYDAQCRNFTIPTTTTFKRTWNESLAYLFFDCMAQSDDADESDGPNLEDAELFCDGASGVYIPQRFAEEVKRECLSGVSEKDMETIARGPDENEWYWDAWSNVLDSAVIAFPDGRTAYLYQDGDLWVVPNKA